MSLIDSVVLEGHIAPAVGIASEPYRSNGVGAGGGWLLEPDVGGGRLAGGGAAAAPVTRLVAMATAVSRRFEAAVSRGGLSLSSLVWGQAITKGV